MSNCACDGYFDEECTCSDPDNNRLCPFCGGVVDPEGWLDGNGKRGPACEVCGSTAPDMETWNGRYTGKIEMPYE